MEDFDCAATFIYKSGLRDSVLQAAYSIMFTNVKGGVLMFTDVIVVWSYCLQNLNRFTFSVLIYFSFFEGWESVGIVFRMAVLRNNIHMTITHILFKLIYFVKGTIQNLKC